jgi:hypothetical protein
LSNENITAVTALTIMNPNRMRIQLRLPSFLLKVRKVVIRH